MTKNKYYIALTATARRDLKTAAKSKYKSKVEEILLSLEQNPYASPPLFEKLVGCNKFSCKINKQHRVVYGVDEETKTITIFSCWTHYHDN